MSLIGMYITLAEQFLGDMEAIEIRRKEKLEAFWVKWDLMKKMPRKKKKRVKKDLLLEYSILSWNPMEEMFSFNL